MRAAALAGLALLAATVLLPSASAAPSSQQAAGACVYLVPPAVDLESCRAVLHGLVDYSFDKAECLLGPHPYYCISI